MTEFNLPLLRTAVEWAESEASKPEGDSEWYQAWFSILGQDIDRTCGTAYCIAGYVAHQAGGHNISIGAIDGDETGSVAMDLLGIDSYDAWGVDWGDYYQHDGLFFSDNTIEDVRLIAEQIALRYGEVL